MDNVKKLFVQALIEAENKEISKLKGEDEIEWEFSEKFENSMNKLIRKNNHIRLSTRRTVRRGLLAAIIALIAVFSGLMSVSATREPIVNFIMNKFGGTTEIKASESYIPTHKTIEKNYIITDIPEGYALYLYEENEHDNLTVWKNANGSILEFSQDLLSLSFSIDNKFNCKKLEINGYEAFYYTGENFACLVWTDGEYWFKVYGTADAEDYIMTAPYHIIEKN